MTDLHSKIMRRAAFYEHETKARFEADNPLNHDPELRERLAHLQMTGASKENLRLLPLIEALANCAKALELCQKAIASGYSPHQDAGQVVYDTARTESTIALSSLAGIVGEE